MSLLDVLVLVILLFVCSIFWQSRGIAEAARNHVKRYCEQHDLQMISISRTHRRLAMVQGKLGWRSTYSFEFSGNRENKYTGEIVMLNKIAKRIDVPAYRVD